MLSGFNSSYTSLGWTRGYLFLFILYYFYKYSLYLFINYIRLAMPDQSENVTIKSISGRTVTLNYPLNFTHWGVGVQRAEVA